MSEGQFNMRSRAKINIGLSKDGGTFSDIFAPAPLKALVLGRKNSDVHTTVLINASGGILAGDSLSIDITAQPRTHCVIASLAAEKVYKSSGDIAQVRVNLALGKGSEVEWQPLETILFDKSRFYKRMTFHVDIDAQLLAGEMNVLGRAAFGEVYRCGQLCEHWEIFQNNHMIYRDVMRFDEKLEILDLNACFKEIKAFATIIYVGSGGKYLQKHFLKRFEGDFGILFGITFINGVCVLKMAGSAADKVRDFYIQSFSFMRHEALKRSEKLNRFFYI